MHTTRKRTVDFARKRVWGQTEDRTSSGGGGGDQVALNVRSIVLQFSMFRPPIASDAAVAVSATSVIAQQFAEREFCFG